MLVNKEQKIKKKILTIITSMIMAISGLTACGDSSLTADCSKTESSNSMTESSSSAQTTTSETQTTTTVIETVFKWSFDGQGAPKNGLTEINKYPHIKAKLDLLREWSKKEFGYVY